MATNLLKPAKRKIDRHLYLSGNETVYVLTHMWPKRIANTAVILSAWTVSGSVSPTEERVCSLWHVLDPRLISDSDEFGKYIQAFRIIDDLTKRKNLYSNSTG